MSADLTSWLDMDEKAMAFTPEEKASIDEVQRLLLIRRMRDITPFPLAATEASASPVPHVEVVASNSHKETIA
jgi:hypothetical protein